MTQLHPEYIVDKKGYKKSVVLPYKEWEKLIEDIEELEDIRAYDAAKTKNEESLSFDEAVAEIRGSHR